MKNQIPGKHLKIILRLVLFVVVFFFYDTLLDMLITHLHSILQLLHYLFEMFEHALDALIEHLFHTDPHTTEIIVFYILALLAGGIGFKIMTSLPRWYCKVCDRVKQYIEQEKANAIVYWRQQSLAKKLKLGSIVVTSSMFMIFLAIN